MHDLALLCNECITIARNAGEVILDIYKTGFDIESKEDNTPLTTADIAAHQTIYTALTRLTPQIPILSEEDADIPFNTRQNWQTYWLVDPLDGTREFIKKNDEFTVNIALIHQGESVLGVINAPVLQTDYYAYKHGGAYKIENSGSPQKIQARKQINHIPVIAGSRSHASKRLQIFLDAIGPHELISLGSSLKSCYVAEGKADLYARFGLTSEWDTAAAQCIVEEAGAHLVKTDLTRLRYNTKESLLNPEFLVFGDAQFNWVDYIDIVNKKS